MLLHGDGSAQPLPTTGVGAGASAVVTPFNADASTNNFNVTINGDARSNNFNPYQAGYYSNYFDGSGDYINAVSANTANAMGTGDWTVECWVYKTNSTLATIFDTLALSGASTDAIRIYINASNAISFYKYSTSVTTGGSVTLNTWNHVAVVRQSSEIKIYLNGTQVNTTYTDTGSNYTCGANRPSSGIDGFDNSSNPFQGFISNLRAVKGTAVYTGSFTPSTTPLTAISGTSLLTCQSNRFIDNSTNAFTITKNGDTAVSPAQPFTLPSSVATYGSGYLDGSGDQLTVANNSAFDVGSGNFTVEAWVYLSGTSGSVFNYSNGQSTNANFAWEIYQNSATSIQVSVFQSTTQYTASSTSLIANAWNHVAGVRNGNTLTIYVNGVAGGTTASVTGVTVNNPSGATVKVSGYNNASAVITGYVADARMVKGTAVYTSAFTPPTAPLTAVSGTSLLTTQYNGGGNNNGFKDSSQNNFVITRAGNTTQGTFTPYGADWSNYFNGSSDYLTMPDNANYVISGDFTVEAWIYPTSFAGTNGNIVLAQWPGGTASNQSFQFYVNSTGKVGLVYGIGATNAAVVGTSLSCTLNTWNHIAVTRSGTTVRYFVNGALDATSSTVSGAFNNSTGVMSVGRINASDSGYFSGYISNCRLVIGTALYTTAFTPSITPITAVSGTQVLVCQSNRFLDNSSNAAAITVAGTPSVQSFSPFVPLVVYNPAVNGGSAYFDGSGDYLSAPTNTSFNLFNQTNATVEFWVYLNAYSSDQDPVSYYSSGSSQWFCQLAGGQANQPIKWYVDGSGQNVSGNTTSSTFPIKAWHHLAFVKSGSNWTIYLNGAQLATAATAPSVSISGTLYVGGRTPTVNLVNGYLADVRITNTVVYSGAFTPPTAPLTAVTGTSLLLNATNAAIFDNAMMNDLETVGNAQISTSVKKFGAASMYFDGSGDYLVPNAGTSDLYAFGTGAYTIEFWIYFNSTATTYLIYDTRPSGVNGFYPTIYFDSSAGYINFYLNGAIRITGTVATASGSWHHVALCRSGTSTKLFINGTQSGSTYTDSNTYLGAASRPTIGGDGNAPGSNGLNGYIDDLRVTKGYARYTTTFTPPTAAFPNG
jgi:hypothetical protein